MKVEILRLLLGFISFGGLKLLLPIISLQIGCKKTFYVYTKSQ